MQEKRYITKKKLVILYREKDSEVFEKRCTQCNEWQSIDSFQKLPGSFLNKHNCCKKCEAARFEHFRRSKGIPAKQPTVQVENGVTKRPCSRCKLVKSLEDFDTNPSGYLGHDSDCSECKRRRGELYRRGKGIKAPRTVSILTDESGYPTHRECSRCKNMLPLEQFNKHRLAYLGIHPYCKECSSARHLMGKYGMTPEDKSYLYLMQKECCAICLEFVELEKIHVDHCHKTGRVRGLLCSSCNKALGLVKDDPLTCQNMMNYLQANAIADKHTK